MTSMESLYPDDALGHAQFPAEQCRAAAEPLCDANLKSCAAKLAEQHSQMYARFYDQI